MIAQDWSSARSITQYSWVFRPPRKLIENLALREPMTILPLAPNTLAGPEGAPLRQTWITEKAPVSEIRATSPRRGAALNSVVAASQSR